jgi:hypothetical protein
MWLFLYLSFSIFVFLSNFLVFFTPFFPSFGLSFFLYICFSITLTHAPLVPQWDALYKFECKSIRLKHFNSDSPILEYGYDRIWLLCNQRDCVTFWNYVFERLQSSTHVLPFNWREKKHLKALFWELCYEKTFKFFRYIVWCKFTEVCDLKIKWIYFISRHLGKVLISILGNRLTKVKDKQWLRNAFQIGLPLQNKENGFLSTKATTLRFNWITRKTRATKYRYNF